MTAAAALTHPWLAGTGERLQAKRDAQRPQQPLAIMDVPHVERLAITDASMAQESLLSLGPVDVSMAAISTPPPTGYDLPQDMSLDNQGVDGAPGSYSQVSSTSQNPTYCMPGAFHANAAIGNKGSRYGLQRRSRVIADAEANGHRLLQPSVEMIAQAASQNQKNATSGPSNPLKRKVDGLDSSLTPVPEEIVQEDQAMGAASDQEHQPAAIRRSKRGRKSSEPETPQRNARRSNPPKSKRGRTALDSTGEQDEDMHSSPSQDGGVRRSPRNVSGGKR